MRPKIGDVFVYIFIVLLVGLSFLGLKVMSKNQDEAIVQVELDGSLVESVKLPGEETQGLTREIRVEAGQGGYNIIKISSRGVEITEADCPDKLCVKSPKITSPGQSIVCIPHKLIVRIVGRRPRGQDVDDTAS